jgi:predicted DNA-binding transcriptional regulator AlpA
VDDELDLLTIEEVAALTRKPVATLYGYRHRGLGPRSFRLGRRVMYTRSDVLAWVRAQWAADEPRGPA